MLIDTFILYTIINFFMFFIGLTNVIGLIKETRLAIMIIATILFFYLAAESFNIENRFCVYSSGWQCTTQKTSELPIAALNFGFGIMSLVYVISEIYNMFKAR